MREIMRRVSEDIKDLWPVALGLLVYTVLVNVFFHAFCPMLLVTGIPCPGCGMTRAIVLLLSGHPAESLKMHPLAPLAVILFIYIGWNRYMIGKKSKTVPILLGASVVLLLLCYLIRMLYLFPENQPLLYMENNLLSRTIPYYKQILYGFKIL